MRRLPWLVVPVLAIVLLLTVNSRPELATEVRSAAHAISERLQAVDRRIRPDAWKRARLAVETRARMPADFVYQGDTLAIRKVTSRHRRLITGKLDYGGVRAPDGSCKRDDLSHVHVNPTYGLFPEVGQVNFRTCAVQIWVIDPHLPEYGPMKSDSTVWIAPR